MKKLRILNVGLILSAILLCSCENEEIPNEQVNQEAIEGSTPVPGSNSIYNEDFEHRIDGIVTTDMSEFEKAYEAAAVVDINDVTKIVTLYSTDEKASVMKQYTESEMNADIINIDATSKAEGNTKHHDKLMIWFLRNIKNPLDNRKYTHAALLEPRDNNIFVGKIDMRPYANLKWQNLITLKPWQTASSIVVLNHDKRNRVFEMYSNPNFWNKKFRVTVGPSKGYNIKVRGWSPVSYRQWRQ